MEEKKKDKRKKKEVEIYLPKEVVKESWIEKDQKKKSHIAPDAKVEFRG